MVQPIPEGTHTVTPHLTVRGAQRAMDFYARAFGAVEQSRMPGPDGTTIMHAEMKIGDSLIYLADEFPGMGSHSPQALKGSPVMIHLYAPDVDGLFNRAVGAGAKVTMPLTDMFWGDRYGQLQDPFGHLWSMATHTEDLTPEEMMKRAESAFPEPPPAAARKRTPARKKTPATKKAPARKAAPEPRAKRRR